MVCDRPVERDKQEGGMVCDRPVARGYLSRRAEWCVTALLQETSRRVEWCVTALLQETSRRVDWCVRAHVPSLSVKQFDECPPQKYQDLNNSLKNGDLAT